MLFYIVIFQPNCGSLLQDGQFFRYTPYQNYYGNDSFMYTISDVNGNLAFATVSIDVLNIPPQFISFPSQLQATEDMISPRYGYHNLSLNFINMLSILKFQNG